jgi:hypothetical protein
MDKITLTKDQLRTLGDFIKSRGQSFAEPAVMFEILDHFACKVEEEMMMDKSLPFPEAIKKAHQSFGVKGFAPLAQAFHQSLHHQYKFWYRLQAKKLFFSVHLIGLLLVAFTVFRLSLYANQLHWPHTDNASILVFMEFIYVVFFYTARGKLSARQKNQIFFEKALTVSSGFILWMWAGLAILIINTQLGAIASAITVALLSFILSFNLILFSRLLVKVKKDVSVIEAQLEQF